MDYVAGCTCSDCYEKTEAEQRREDKRLERQSALYAAVEKLNNKSIFPAPEIEPKEYAVGTWLGIERTSIPEFKSTRESKMAVFRVLAIRKTTKVQPDGSLLPVEQLITDQTVVATSNACAILIAGKAVEEDAEALSTTTVTAVQLV